MSDCLIIVESPTKVKTIKRFLGDSYDIEATVGHIRDLPSNQLGVDTDNDFKPRYINIPGKSDVISKIKKKAASAKRVLIASDPDREGEAIAWHAAKILGIDPSEPCRITFNEITAKAVNAALQSPRAIDMNLVDAQQARRILDRIVGYKISPILWKKVQKGLSAGRVQSVAVRMICDREREISEFKPEEYWTLTADLSPEKERDKSFIAKYYGENGKKKALPNLAAVERVLADAETGDYTVSGVKKGTKARNPAPPFTTSSLQQDASAKYGFSSKITMRLAQELYEGVEIAGSGSTGLVTYIRTDSTRIAEEARAAAKEIIIRDFGREYLPEKDRYYRNKSGSQDAHEAIRPAHLDLTPGKVRGSLSPNQYKLYKLIWDRFMASLMASAKYDTMQVDVDCKGHTFRATGSRVTFQGYLAVYDDAKEDSEDSDTGIKLPALAEGDRLILNSLDKKQNFTQPPARYTEATLIKAMEEGGIGRPSTYAPTISTILDRSYVEKEKKYLVPTTLGQTVDTLLRANFSDIVDKGFTADMESRLDSVSEGQTDWKELLRDFYGPFMDNVKKADASIDAKVSTDEPTDEVCEKCGKPMVIKNGRNGRFMACSGYPDCKNTRPIRVEAGVACPKCGAPVLQRETRNKKKYLVCEKSPACDYMEWGTVDGNKKCPTCGSFMVTGYYGRRKTFKCGNPACPSRAKEVKKDEPAD